MRCTAAAFLLAFTLSGCGGCDGSSAGEEGRCGDGVLDDGEGCEPGAAVPGACRPNCTVPRCGDGVPDDGEACDAGAENRDVPGAACRTDCTPARCGDGVVDAGEECDDGARNGNAPPAVCRTDCVATICGDGVVGPGEECDDGEDNSDTLPAGCRSGCRMAYCGDGVIDPGERCDEGEDNSDTAPGACRTACVPPRCGDHVVDPGEGCDLGAQNGGFDSSCRADCSPVSCGDGIRDPGEGCDHGPDNSDVEPDACRESCVPASCGDGVIDRHETCDDGAANSDHAPDACRTSCVAASCGDGVADTGEACDDGASNSDVNSGACRTTCVGPACGDRVVDPGEGCDDGGFLPGDGCDASCAPEGANPACGNGVTDPPEECDDGNRVDGDGCSFACVSEVATCAGLGPLLDLAAVGTLEPSTGWVLHQGTLQTYEASLTQGTCGGEGPERFYLYRPASTGSLIVEATISGRTWRASAVEARRHCAVPSTELACKMAPGWPLVVEHVEPADGPIYLVVDGGLLPTDGTAVPLTYTIRARVLPHLRSGAACQIDGSTGTCDPAAGLACVPGVYGSQMEGTCVVRVPVGGSCAGDVPCVIGAACDRSGPNPVCRTMCGNRHLDPGEGCDDGNTVDGDNCSNACIPAGDDCTHPFDLSAAWDPAAGRARWEGQLETYTPGFLQSCSGNPAYVATAEDAVFSFTAPAAAVYSFALEPDGWRPALSLFAGGCVASGTELGCRQAYAPGQASFLTVPLAAGQTVWGVVDGYGPVGSFVLTVEVPACGDGRVALPETCDDGNTAPGDGCNGLCRLEGESCADAWAIPWDPATAAAVWRGTTHGRVADYTASCLVAAYQPEAVGRFVAPAAGRYAFALAPDYGGSLVLWRGGCVGTGTEAGCVESVPPGPVRYLAADLAAGEAVHVVVDGEDALYSHEARIEGDFELTIRAIVCGNGRVEAPEDCDDGNLAAGDGCSPACRTERVELEPNETPGQATAIPRGVLVRGETGGPDVYAFPVERMRSYRVRSWSGAMGTCLGAVDLTVRNGSGARVAEVLAQGYGCAEVPFTAAEDGTYYLHVLAGKGYSETPAGSYFFRID